MDAAAAHDLHGRGVPRLLRHFDTLARLTAEIDDGLSVRARLERELGCDLAELLVCALVRRDAGGSSSLSLCA